MNSVNIRKNDTVRVISGSSAGKTGRVLRVEPREGKVLVEHVGIVKKHLRADQRQKGGVATQERPINISNVQLVCKSCNQPVRVGRNEQGQRVCKKCNTLLE
jgi:large subunit ribosomal protein L24